MVVAAVDVELEVVEVDSEVVGVAEEADSRIMAHLNASLALAQWSTLARTIWCSKLAKRTCLTSMLQYTWRISNRLERLTRSSAR